MEHNPKRVVGLYVGGGGCYPYGPAGWSIGEWERYCAGLKQLGYNSILIWTAAELMPEPLSKADQARLDSIAKLVQMLHGKLGMRLYSSLCPNVAPHVSTDPADAGLRVNPADPAAVARHMRRMEGLFRRFPGIDGFFVIDSDPGGYPGSTNAEFVGLFREYREMLDRLRPRIELYYWQHAGWEAYCRFYQTGKFALGTDDEFADTVSKLKSLNPEPWGFAKGRVWGGGKGMAYARKLGVESRVLDFQYSRIEPEPQFPMTIFGCDEAHEAGASGTPRGVMGNVTNPLMQLPGIFAFGRGAKGQKVAEKDYVSFADDLIRGHGKVIVEAWKTLAGTDATAMRDLAAKLDQLSAEHLRPGKLAGLMLDDPRRFLTDLVMQLRLKASAEDFCSASEQGADVHGALRAFGAALESWIGRHHVDTVWSYARLETALRKLDSPYMTAAMDMTPLGSNPEERARLAYVRQFGYMSRIAEAIKLIEKAPGSGGR